MSNDNRKNNNYKRRNSRYNKGYRHSSNLKNDNKKPNPSTSNSTRENRHQNLYDEDYSITKQQIFDFDEMKFSDELDTSFVENKKKKKEDIIGKLNQSYEKQSRVRSVSKKPKVRLGRFFVVLLIFLLLILVIVFAVYAFVKPPKEVIVTKEKKVVVVDDNYLFLGDSITDYYDLEEYYEDMPVVNSGVSGNTSEDILDDMKERVYQYNPSKVFLLIGTNDIQHEFSEDEIVENIQKILEEIHENRPYAELYLESIYPVDEEKEASKDRTNDVIMEINERLEEYCKKEKITYINLFDQLVDKDSDEVVIKEEYTKDGLHLSDDGYEVVTKEIKKYLK